MMRCFIAISLPQNLKAQIGEIQNGLKKSGLRARWVRPENIHLTLSFLGEIENPQAEKMKEGMDQLVEEINPFSIDISGMGVFASPKNVRVIWIGCHGAWHILKSLNIGIVKCARDNRIQVDGKSFKPHLTIARCNPPLRNFSVSDEFWNCKLDQIEVKEIHLVESQLLPEGAKYSVLHTSSLK